MKLTPDQIADRLMAPSAGSAYWNADQVKALIIEAIREEREEVPPRPARTPKTER